ncbi:hypothetical protein ACFWNC_13715 [Streptomyces sp. NPDC058369]
MGELVAVEVAGDGAAAGAAGREAARKLAWPVLEIAPRKNQQSSGDGVR